MGPALPNVDPLLLVLAPGPFVPVGVPPTPPLLEDPIPLGDPKLLPDEPKLLPDEPKPLLEPLLEDPKLELPPNPLCEPLEDPFDNPVEDPVEDPFVPPEPSVLVGA
jgi:hypothetical protein